MHFCPVDLLAFFSLEMVFCFETYVFIFFLPYFELWSRFVITSSRQSRDQAHFEFSPFFILRTFENALLLPANESTNSNGVRKGHAECWLEEVTTASDVIFACFAFKQSKQPEEVLFLLDRLGAILILRLHIGRQVILQIVE